MLLGTYKHMASTACVLLLLPYAIEAVDESWTSATCLADGTCTEQLDAAPAQGDALMQKKFASKLVSEEYEEDNVTLDSGRGTQAEQGVTKQHDLARTTLEGDLRNLELNLRAYGGEKEQKGRRRRRRRKSSSSESRRRSSSSSSSRRRKSSSSGSRRRRKSSPKPSPSPSSRPSPKPSSGSGSSPKPSPGPAPGWAAGFFPPTPPGQEEIFGDYLDIVAGSSSGTLVTGRLNPKANRVGALSDWEFRLTRDVDNVFELMNQRDHAARLFGVLRVKKGATVGAAGTVHALSAELVRVADGVVMGKLDFNIHSVQQTVLKQIESKVRGFAKSDDHCYGRSKPSDSAVGSCSGVSYRKTTGAWDPSTKEIGGLGYALSHGTKVPHKTVKSCILERCRKLVATVPIDKKDMLDASKFAALKDPLKHLPCEGFADFQNNGLSHNKVTHQWELTDALTLPGIEVAEDAFLAALKEGPDSPAAQGLDGLLRLISVNFAINPRRRRIGVHERWGNLLDVNHSTGVWSDANLAHRLRTWIGMLWIWQDYNLPATYIPYWYNDFDFKPFTWYNGKKISDDALPANFRFVPSFSSPRGVFADIKGILSGAYAKPHKYGFSGFNPDGFITHHQDYCHDTAMTAYGFEWLSDPLRVANILKDTPWALEPKWVMTAANYLAYSYSRIVYKGHIDWILAGRNYFFRGNWRWRRNNMVPTIRLLLDNLGDAISKPLIKELEAMAATEDGPEALGNTAFWNSDTMVHRKKGWYMSLRMRSVRTTGNEDFEKKGKSWHSGSGVFLTRVHGDEYDLVRTNMDWHLLPGITEEWRDDPIPKKGNRCGGGRYATMASDGDLGAAAFINQPASTDPYSSVTAGKSVFFLDSGAVLLGNSITRATVDGQLRTGQGKPIVTVIEQALWRGSITYQVGLNGQVMTLPFGKGCNMDVEIGAGETAWLHQGSVGYVIKNPAEPSGKVVLQTRCGSEVAATDKQNWQSEAKRQGDGYFGSEEVFLAVINHGSRPVDASYSYAVLPGLSASDLPSKAFSFFGPRGVVAVNTPGVQAVIDTAAQMAQAAFFEKGTSLSFPFDYPDGQPQAISVTADRPGIVHMRRHKERWTLSVAEGTKDPSAKTMTLTFDRPGIFAEGSLDYTFPGVTPRKAVDKVTIADQLGKSQIVLNLPDGDDDAAYDYQGEMYLGAPITISIPMKGHAFPATSAPAATTSPAPVPETTPAPTQPSTPAPAPEDKPVSQSTKAPSTTAAPAPADTTTITTTTGAPPADEATTHPPSSPHSSAQRFVPISERKSATLGWESGTVDSGLAVPLEPSFSKNGKSPVVDSRGKMYVSNELHNLSVVEVPWARQGTHVLKVCADGRNFGSNSDYAWRSELGAVQDEYSFKPGDYHYYTMSFWPDETWDQVAKYSTVISQWKMSPGFPHAALRLSNTGDYKLTFRGYDLWEAETDEGKFIGHATPGAWNDIKVHSKFSMGDDGFVMVWLNGVLVFDHRGRSLLKNTPRGYVKFGMYTELRDLRRIYFDAVSFSNFLDIPFAQWAKNQAHLPVVSLKNPSHTTHLPSGSKTLVTANAHDHGGEKFGTVGSVAKVEFFAGKCSIGVATVKPYSTAFAPTDGPYSLRAVVTDADGNIATSSAVEMYVGNKPPEVALISPQQLASLRSGESVEISAKAFDPDGSVSQVVIFVGQEQIGIATDHTKEVYSFTWQPKTAGAYTLHAVATDGESKAGRTKSVLVTVDATIETSAIKALDDASIREGSPTEPANWGEVEIYGKAGARIVGIFKFDISPFRHAPEIRDAQLRLYNVKGEGGVLSVFGAVGTNWREDEVTWSKGPSRADRISSLTLGAPGEYYDFDVTAYISDRAGGSDALVTFWLEFESLNYEKVEFESRRGDKSNPPELKVTTSSIAVVDDDQDVPGEDTSDSCPDDKHDASTSAPAPAEPAATTSSEPIATTAPSSTSTASPSDDPAQAVTSTVTPCPEASDLEKKVEAIARKIDRVAREVKEIVAK